ncbi:transcriptional regulator with XRE-family HTH domain [Scopulibacillus daqui]|uniref:Transcriptional regulator with XRE-family HTH domain n=1 Tax=Scopulibacillus daqui TaxID=1469162 RepID=A0ABS2PZX2_9BACL|nr:XRE family transcriptional regulator [Scopulibacillus daqui]MBM7645602.1 transcriptional regulator with XRE-family HTH domain [Scopulibacillus daqui]
MSFAENLKNTRKRKGLTLEELAEKCQVSRSMLSQIERDEKQPTIKVASQIAEGLGTTISQLLDEQKEQEVIIIRKDNRLVYRDPSSGFQRHLLSPSFTTKGIEFILNIIPPSKESGVFPSHKKGVEEYIFVSSGKLQIELGNGEKKYTLNAGDSMYFEANTQHRFINLGKSECHYYLVIDSRPM